MTEEFSGIVVRRRVGLGTKSDHDAVVLLTDDGAFKLRRSGANAFQDDVLDRLVGKRVRARGIVRSGQLIASEVEAVDDC